MWTLTYRRPIPREDLLLRVMGPDRDFAYYWVTMVEDWDGYATRAVLEPLPPGETRLSVGLHGQEFIAAHAVEVDDRGTARLTRETF